MSADHPALASDHEQSDVHDLNRRYSRQLNAVENSLDLQDATKSSMEGRVMTQHSWIMKAGWVFGALAVAMASLGVAQAQETKVIPVAAKRCSCGRWTCPICQQQRLKQTCPPGQLIVPGIPSVPSMPYPSMPNQMPSVQGDGSPTSPQFNFNDNAPGAPSTGNLSPEMAAPGAMAPGQTDAGPQFNPNAAQLNLNDAASPSADAADSLSRAAQSTNQSGLLASNTGGLADPGLIGDFFGPTANGPSIISQEYSVWATGISNGGFVDLETTNNPSFNDISTNGPFDNRGVAPLGLPYPATDLPSPTEPGYVFGGGTATLQSGGNLSIGSYLLNYGYQKTLIVPSSFSQQRIKLAENTSPIPQNRIFMNYSLFGNVPLTESGINVNRFSPGFETLLFSPKTSFEMRTPFATTLSSDILLDGGTNTNNVEFGNLFFSLKHVLYQRNQLLISSGLSLTAPTADSIRIVNGVGTEVVRINNESVHLMPFIGFYKKMSQRAFTQGFLQVDVDANGNRVYHNPNVQSNSLNQIGRLHDMTLLYLDLNAGYWVYRSTGSGLTGIAPLIEGHMNRSLNHADCVIDATGRTRIQLPIQEFDNFNAVGAIVFEFNRRSRLAFGYGVPIGNGKDRAFDNELRITFNRFF